MTWSIIYDGSKFHRNSPKARAGSAITIYDNFLYIFGGTKNKTKMNDLWKFNLIKKQWN
jgi:hypothetical protein